MLMVGEPDYGDGENCLFRHCIGGWLAGDGEDDGDGFGWLVMVMVMVMVRMMVLVGWLVMLMVRMVGNGDGDGEDGKNCSGTAGYRSREKGLP